MPAPRPGRLWLVGPIAAVLMLGTIFAGPRHYESTWCLFCGCHKVKEQWLGLNIPHRVWENECSRWVRSFHPDHADHIWVTSSIRLKGWGPGWTFGCGPGAGGLMAIHLFRSQLGEQPARDLLVRYHSELKGDRESFRRFIKTELPALLTNSTPRIDAGAEKDIAGQTGPPGNKAEGLRQP